MMRRAALLFGTLFGSGFSPLAPGTAGSLVAVLIVAAVPADRYSPIVALLALVAALAGPRLADELIAQTGRHDPGRFVLDEAAGLWLAAWRPEKPGAMVLVAVFFAFRLFDIWKPWPAGALERLPGGLGVVADDVAAGAYALALTWALQVALGW